VQFYEGYPDHMPVELDCIEEFFHSQGIVLPSTQHLIIKTPVLKVRILLYYGNQMYTHFYEHKGHKFMITIVY